MTARDWSGQLYRRASRGLPRPLRFIVDGIEASLRGTPHLIRHLDLSLGLLRRRLNPEDLFVGWLLYGNEEDGATRVRALLPHAYLRRLGVNSVILRKPREPSASLRLREEDRDRIVRARFEVVVFQRVYREDAEALARALRAAGTRTVFAVGDFIRCGMPEVVDQVVVAAETLRAVAPGREDQAEVIEAVIDAPPGLVKDYSRPPAREEIRVVWVGYPENLQLLEPVREALRDPRLARFRLITISSGEGVTLQWDRKRVHRQLLDCDIAVLPSAPGDWYAAKPNSRMTMLKALGLPIVASPVGSYLRTLEHGRGCYYARDVGEWVEHLARLAEPEERRAQGLAERERILATYGLEAIGGRWLGLLERLAGRRVLQAARPRGAW